MIEWRIWNYVSGLNKIWFKYIDRLSRKPKILIKFINFDFLYKQGKISGKSIDPKSNEKGPKINSKKILEHILIVSIKVY